PTPLLGNISGTASAQTTAQLASYNLALSLLGTSSSTAINNIQMIVNGGQAGATGGLAGDPGITSLV
ncbi:MAG: hypothetical protein ACREFW_06785, partial [Rhizomicrobium sp.]